MQQQHSEKGQEIHTVLSKGKQTSVSSSSTAIIHQAPSRTSILPTLLQQKIQTFPVPHYPTRDVNRLANFVCDYFHRNMLAPNIPRKQLFKLEHSCQRMFVVNMEDSLSNGVSGFTPPTLPSPTSCNRKWRNDKEKNWI